MWSYSTSTCITVRHVTCQVAFCWYLKFCSFSRVCFQGNGTQSLIWQINEETYRQKLEESTRPASPDSKEPAESKPGLQIFYGSLHDILSYPCEVDLRSTTNCLPTHQMSARMVNPTWSRPPQYPSTGHMASMWRTYTYSPILPKKSSGQSCTRNDTLACLRRPMSS